MRAVIVGAVDSTAATIEEVGNAPGWSVPLVVTLPDELRARHSDFYDLAPLAERAGAEIFRAANSNAQETIAAIRAARPDYLFVIGWSQICRPEFLEICPGKAIGYHPAALPRLRGRAVIPWTILLDEPITASSLFWLADGTDTGDILRQEFIHVASDETAQTLYDKHMSALRCMLPVTLAELASGVERRIPQDDRYATWAAKRTPQDGLIDWRDSAKEIDRLVRAVGRPYPGAFTDLAGAKLVIWKASPVDGAERQHAMPGQIVACEGGSLTIQTGSGLLTIHEWQTDPDAKPPRMHQLLGVADR